MPKGDLGPVLEFLRLLWAIEQGLNRTSRAMLRSHGITGEQRLLVRVLGKLGPTTPGRLATTLHLHPATVIRLARPLERARILVRRPDPGDGRQVLLALGPAARKVDALDAGTVEAAVRAALRKVPAARVGAARDVLVELARQLGVRHPARKG